MTTRALSMITTLGLLLCASPASAYELMSQQDMKKRVRLQLRDFPQPAPNDDFDGLSVYRAKRAQAIFMIKTQIAALERQGLDTTKAAQALQRKAGDGAEAALNQAIAELSPHDLRIWGARLGDYAGRIALPPPRLPQDYSDRGAIGSYEFQLLLFGGREARVQELRRLQVRLSERFGVVTDSSSLMRPALNERWSAFEAQLINYSQGLRAAREAMAKGLSAREGLERALSQGKPPLPVETAFAFEIVREDPNDEEEEEDVFELLFQNHTVEVGDSLDSISRRYKTTVPILGLANRTSPEKLRELLEPGLELIIPRGDDLVQSVAIKDADGSLSHWLARGESPEDVVTLYGISLQDLMLANPGHQMSDWISGKLIKLPPKADTAKVDHVVERKELIGHPKKQPKPFQDEPLGQ